MSDATAFLYSGPNRLQFGVDPAVMDPARVAVLRGVVLDAMGTPVDSAMITALGHPEYGHTYSRVDGAFDFAVNGGGSVVLVYSKDGYLPIQRSVFAPWNDFAWLPDVRLTPVDIAVTTILPGGIDTQVARGSPVIDADGNRQATLLFPPGITGSMTMPDGTSVPLTEMSVRATEFTVGPSGRAAMPADLPKTSAYTYAVELSLDEAMMAGAASVEFNGPVPFYLDNFLGFPAGTAVPVGVLDRGVGKWVPSPDGIVIKILDTSSGIALVDTNGDDVADDDARLSSLGITSAERATLAQLYTAGKTLWRMQTTHFSVFDLNWCWGCDLSADGSPACVPPSPPVPPQPDTPEPRPDCSGGSIIECQGQVLREAIPLAGTPYALWYSSREQSGNAAARTIRIPMTDVTLPAGALSVVLEVSVMGQRLHEEYSPAPSLYREFTWDGNDGYGRRWQGTVVADVRIGFTYRPVYLGAQSVAGQTRSFAAVASRGGTGVYSVIPGRAEPTFVSWTSFKVPITHWDARGLGLGGWTLSEHAAYDRAAMTVHKGDGTISSGTDLRVIEAAAGGGQGGWNLDRSTPIQGTRAVEAAIPPVGAMTIGADGSVLFLAGGLGYPYPSDTYLWRLSRDGGLYTIAGGPYGCSADEDVPASSACVLGQTALAIGPDGGIYYSEYYGVCGSHVRRISPDGTVRTVFGTRAPTTIAPGTCLDPDDGIPAHLARFSTIQSVAFGADGDAYLLEASSHVWRITQDGLLHRVAGFGATSTCSNPTDAVATTRLFGASDLAFGPDGNLYVVEQNCNRVRRLTPDGIWATVAGGGGSAPSDGDGGKATSAVLVSPNKLAFTQRGEMFIAEPDVHRLRVVSSDGIITTYAGKRQSQCPVSVAGAPALGNGLCGLHALATSPGGDAYVDENGNPGGYIRHLRWRGGSDVVPASSGESYDLFDTAGRIVARVDAMTGVARFQYGYGPAGTLTSISDAAGRATTIERDGSGQIQAIVSPDGERTTLGVDGNGFLSFVANPASEAVTLRHGSSGLLESFTDPRGAGYEHTFSYDTKGRLTLDQNPAGGFKTLARTDAGTAYSVAVSTALGRTDTYQVESLATKQTRFTRTRADGTSEVRLVSNDGTQITTSADGTTMTSSLTPDPRFGLQAATATVVLRAPSAKSMTVAKSRTATLSNPADFQSATSLGETLTVNGRAYSSTYDVTNRVLTNTSAGGRTAVAIRDAQGRVTEIRPPGYPALSPTFVSYDTAGRARTITTGSRTFSLTYGSRGFVESMTDPLNRVTSFGYDAAGRVQTQLLPGSRGVTFGYDGAGNMTSLVPPGRPAHGFGYTSIDEVRSYDPPAVAGSGTTSTTYEYDADGELSRALFPDSESLVATWETDASGKRTGRLAAVTTAYGTASFGYDGAGRMQTIAAPSVALGYAYDGFLPTIETWTGGVSGSVGYTYDSDLRVSGVTVNGTSTAQSYDGDGLLTGAGALGIARESATGRISSTTLGVVGTSQTYDSYGALATYSASVSGAEQYRYELTPDALGRIATKSETIAGATHTFDYGYDDEGRIWTVRQDGVLTATYEYDQNGNRMRMVSGGTTNEATYDAQDRLLSYGGVNYTSRPNGELESKTVAGQTTWYAYDRLGNLRQVALSDGRAVEYLVDGRNRRVGKKVNGALVEGFLYEGQLRPVAWLNSAGQVYARFVYGARLNVPEYMVAGGASYRIISDHLGSPRLVVNATTGAIAQRMDYDAWGNLLLDTNPGFQPFGFAGGLYDRDTGLVRFGARDYDPQTGRWTNKDPIRFRGGDTNLYVYVANDPVNFIDPSGRIWLQVGATVVGGVIGGVSAYLNGGDAAQIAQSALVGAGVGLLTSFGLGLESWAAGGFLGYAGGSLGNLLSQRIMFKPPGGCGGGRDFDWSADVNWGRVGLSGALGSIGGAWGGAVGEMTGAAELAPFIGGTVAGIADALIPTAPPPSPVPAR
jgi:RHS repeat-associated protein